MEPAQFLQIIADNTSDIIALYTPDWKYSHISPSVKHVLGYVQAELIGRPVYEIMHPEDLNRILNNTKDLQKSYKTQFLTYRLKRKDGIYIWVESTVRHIENENDPTAPIILGILKDITSKKSSEEMVKKFVEGVEYASDCIVMANHDGQIMYANPAIKSITGYATEDVIGQHANMIWGGLEDANKIIGMWDDLNSGKAYSGEVQNLTKESKPYFTEVHIAPIFNQNKDVTYFVGISRDITKAKEIDRMKNEFISLASHQLRTPLTAIKWRLEMLMGKSFENLEAQQRTYISEIDKSNERMIELVNSLLNISRIESGRLIVDPKLTSLEDLMMSSLDDFQNRLEEKKIKVKLSFQTNIYDVNVDPKLMRNVYMNLLSNSIKYTPDGGTIEISIYIEDKKVITKITDSGYGIPDSEKQRVFDKFYRGSNITKVETEGTGLGLYLVKAIIEASNGKIWFESIEGKGTTFWIAFDVEGMQPKQGEVTLS